MNPKVNWFFEEDTPWKGAYGKLRTILLACNDLTEELKWGCPCYTVNGKNVVLIHGFKEYCALLFHKGALLADRDGILVQQTKNVQSARQVRFASAKEVTRLTATLRRYVGEAVALEKAGAKVRTKRTDEFEMPTEFAARLKTSAPLRRAFAALTPGRQRAYLLHFASAKQSATREARIDRHLDRILDGKGLDD